MWNKNLIPAAILAGIALLCFTALAIAKVDTSAFLVAFGIVATPIILASINSSLTAIKDNTNGNMSSLMEMVKDLQTHLKYLTTSKNDPGSKP
jgi:hypothetical protein